MPDLEGRVRTLENRLAWFAGAAFILGGIGIGVAAYTKYVATNVDKILDGTAAEEQILRINSEAKKLTDETLLNQHTPYSVLSQVQAQAACVGIAGSTYQLVTAARRPRVTPDFKAHEGSGGYVTCNSICNSIRSINKYEEGYRNGCYAGLHIYSAGQNNGNLGSPFRATGYQDTVNPNFGLRTHVYPRDHCSIDKFGPNFCCCNVAN